MKLSECQLHEKQRNASDGQHDQVRNQESACFFNLNFCFHLNFRFQRIGVKSISNHFTSTVFVAQIGKSPDIRQIDSETDDRKQKRHLFVPRFSRLVRNDGDHGGRHLGLSCALLATRDDRSIVIGWNRTREEKKKEETKEPKTKSDSMNWSHSFRRDC